MNKQHIGLVIIAFFLLTLMGNREPEIIYWSDDYKLSWDDFKGHPRYDYKAIDALTSSGIIDYKGCKDGFINYKIKAYFERENSWVKEEAHTDYHLAHEQLHFDITELYARKLRKLLAHRGFKCGEETAFEDFIQANLETWHVEQKNYDIHTRHSLDTDRQREWFYRIKIELDLLSNYAE